MKLRELRKIAKKENIKVKKVKYIQPDGDYSTSVKLEPSFRSLFNDQEDLNAYKESLTSSKLKLFELNNVYDDYLGKFISIL